MPIVVNLDVLMARRKISLGELAARIDLTPANLSVLKNNHARAVRGSEQGSWQLELFEGGF